MTTPPVSTRPIAAMVFFVGCTLFAACKISTDLGTPCFLVKANPDGGTTAVRLREGDLPDAGKDFIAFGATECEDLVCVRDSNYPRNSDPNANATGYCSRACVPTSGACPAANSSDDNDPNKKLNCRALLLDDQTIAAICTQDPAKCNQYFGGTRSPYFCARGTGFTP